MGAIFSEKGQRNVEKGQNIWKFRQEMSKIWIFWKKYTKYSEKGQVTEYDNLTQ